jgi:hypothetical protein
LPGWEFVVKHWKAQGQDEYGEHDEQQVRDGYWEYDEYREHDE